MIALEQRENGLVLPVRAQAGSRKNEIRGVHQGSLKVCVTQVAEKGKANKAILVMLAKALNVKRSQLELLAGETHPHKLFLVTGITQAELEVRISSLM